MAPSGPPAAKAKPGAAKPEAKAKAVKKEYKEEPRPEDLIPKVEPPNDKEFETKLEGIQTAIEKLQKEQAELNGKIKERSGGKDEHQQERLALRQELDKWSALMDSIKAKKDAISGQMGEQKQQMISMKTDLNKMKKSIGYGSEVEIDNRMRDIDYKMSHEVITLKVEKELMKELAELKKNRPKVNKVNDLESNLKSDDRGLPLKEQIKSLNEEMAGYFLEKKKVSEKLKELNEARQQQTGDMPDLIAKREGLSKKIQEKIADRNSIRGERREKENEFRAYQAEVRKIKQERAGADRVLRQKEYEDRKRQQKAEKLDDHPYVQEITLIEQTIKFCNSLTGGRVEKKEEEKKEMAACEMDTHVAYSKKDAEEEMFFAATKVKAKKSKKKADGAGSAKPIKHNAETFQLFDKLKLDAPINTDDVPALLVKLDAQLADYKEKVKEWEAKREEMKAKIMAGEDVEEKAEEKAEDEKAGEKAEE